jgi:predicted dehydrogenase
MVAKRYLIGSPRVKRAPTMTPIRLMTLSPGHFHAALVQKTMHPAVDRRAHVYAPLDADLNAHLGRVAGFNARLDDPTAWELEVHAGPDPLQRLLRERPGNVVVIAGRNRAKIDAIRAAVAAGLHVLADKPWVIRPEDLPKLRETLSEAKRRGVVALDVMTERYEIASILQRELIHDPEVLGTLGPGTPNRPAVELASVHSLMKSVAGVPLRRPAWFFEVREQGEGLADVGTHLVDLAMWMLFPDQPIDVRRDVEVLKGEGWSLPMTKADFRKLTGEPDFPDWLRGGVSDDRFDFACGNQVRYTLRGVHVWVTATWEPYSRGGDRHQATVRGSRSTVSAGPHLSVWPNDEADPPAVLAALRRRVRELSDRFPGLRVVQRHRQFVVTIPDELRTDHESHFARVLERFIQFVQNPAAVPAWEAPNMLAKYTITTRGVALAQT